MQESPLEVLLLLDGLCLPTTLEWIANKDFEEWLYFLLEADMHRYKISDTDTIRNLHRIYNSFLQHGSCVSSIVPARTLKRVREVIDSNIPLKCTLSVICDLVWSKILDKFSSIPSSPDWMRIRQVIMEDVKLDLVTCLADRKLRRYMEEYLMDMPDELACLCCFRDAKDTLDALDKFKSDSTFMQSLSKRRSRNSLAKTRTGRSDSLESETLEIASGIMKRHLVDDVSLGRDDSKNYLYPYEALKVLLLGVRAIQVRYLSHTENKGANDFGRGVPQYNSKLAQAISEHVRLELVELLTQTAHIRDVQALDVQFTRQCAASLEVCLKKMLRELLAYIKHTILPLFHHSVLFVEMIAEYRGRTSNAVSRYRDMKSTLGRINALAAASGSAYEEPGMKYVPWTDPQMHGVSYVSYRHSPSVLTPPACPSRAVLVRHCQLPATAAMVAFHGFYTSHLVTPVGCWSSNHRETSDDDPDDHSDRTPTTVTEKPLSPLRPGEEAGMPAYPLVSDDDQSGTSLVDAIHALEKQEDLAASLIHSPGTSEAKAAHRPAHLEMSMTTQIEDFETSTKEKYSLPLVKSDGSVGTRGTSLTTSNLATHGLKENASKHDAAVLSPNLYSTTQNLLGAFGAFTGISLFRGEEASGSSPRPPVSSSVPRHDTVSSLSAEEVLTAQSSPSSSSMGAIPQFSTLPTPSRVREDATLERMDTFPEESFTMESAELLSSSMRSVSAQGPAYVFESLRGILAKLLHELKLFGRMLLPSASHLLLTHVLQPTDSGYESAAKLLQQPAEDMPLLVTIALCTHAEPGKPELVGVVSVTTFTGLWTAMRQATKSTLLRVQPHVLNTYVHGGARTSSPSHVHYILPSVFVDCAGLHSTLPMKMRCRETISSIYADGKYFSTTDAQTSSLESTLVPAHLAWVDQCYGPSDAPLIEIVEALGESYFTMLLTLFLWNRTVILHSHSSTLLSLVLEALPRLLYPFRCCHRVKQCLDKGEITALVSSVFWMYKDDAVPEATGSSKRAAADDASVSESYTAGDTKSNFSLHSNSWKEVELEELFLITARTEDYMQACASSFQVDEVDGQENTRNVGDMINAAVSGGAVVVCHLDAKKMSLCSKDNTVMNSLLHKYRIHVDLTDTISKVSATTDWQYDRVEGSNRLVRSAVYLHWHKLILQSLPECLLHHPTEQIVGCQTEQLLSLILSDSHSASKSLYVFILESNAFRDLLLRHGLCLHM